MAYGFNDDKSRVEVYSAEEIKNLLAGYYTEQEINNLLAGYYTEQEIDTKLGNKANLASPALTGTPTAPTADNTANNTQIATTAFVRNIFNIFFPVNCVILLNTNTPPSIGTWRYVGDMYVESGAATLLRAYQRTS